MSDHQPKKVFVTGPVVKPATPANPVAGLNPNFTKDVLIVVSKLKNYIRERSEMNTSADVIDALSDQLRKLCDQAIEQARADGRKTVMARDF